MSKSDVTQRDVRETKLWKEVQDYFLNLSGPGFDKVSNATDLDASPDGSRIAFTGSVWKKMEDVPETRICVVETASGQMRTITSGPHNDKLPKWSSDGEQLAFLSDRIEKGIFQFYLAKFNEIGEAKPLSSTENAVEYFHWSPSANRILIGMAGRGADKAGGEGSGGITDGKGSTDNFPPWMPEVNSGDPETSWRTLWVYDTVDGSLRQVSQPGSNIWEASWCGDDKAVGIVSQSPGEGSWYTAKLVTIEIGTGNEGIICTSKRQLGLPCSSPSGSYIAVVQAVCSDRGIIAGDILLVDPKITSEVEPVLLNIGGTDATHLVWRDEESLFFMGQRGLKTVAGDINVTNKDFKETWLSSETCGFRYPQATPFADGLMLVCNSWTRYPEIAQITNSNYRTIVSLDNGGGRWLQSKLGPVEEISWYAPDGLEIQGLLHLPNSGAKPFALVLNVHGGPVWGFRNMWLGVQNHVALLVSRGYAVLNVNPRGSGGRGQDFAEKVYGDMGGADVQDFLSGIDYLVARGIADPSRLGVTGGSYGGFMSSWIITQTDRFAAAVPEAPVTDWLSQHTTSNIPYFDSIFLDQKPYASDGLYAERSPVRFAGRYSTPVLQIAGANDRCTPPTQALQYHLALLEQGVTSVLATYPGEGHGVRKFPAVIDKSHRMLSWFEKYMPA